MTPAIVAAQKAGVAFRTHHYEHNPKTASYGLEAAEALNLSPNQVFKTLVADVEGKGLVVAVLPVAKQLNLKALAVAVGHKRAVMAAPAKAERATGYVLGGISPLGQRRPLPTVVDSSANNHNEIYCSAGRRGLEISLAPSDLADLLRATIAAIAA